MRQGKAICFVALATLTLLVPALINRSPFVFYDARHYLELGRSLIRPLHMDLPLIAVPKAIMQPAIAAWLGLPWNDAWRWIAPPVSGAMAGALGGGPVFHTEPFCAERCAAITSLPDGPRAGRREKRAYLHEACGNPARFAICNFQNRKLTDASRILWFTDSDRGVFNLALPAAADNAMLYGVLSGPTERYQGRISWLIFALAMLA